jgi:hypothetical protein
MGSHRHHGASSPPDQEDDIHPVNTSNTPHPTPSDLAKKLGDAIDDLDPELLNFVLGSIRTYDKEDAIYYVAKAIKLARKSEEYAMAEKVTMEAKAELSGKMVAMFALGFIAGGSCTLMAVDEGFIETLDDSGDDGGSGVDGGIPA